MKTTTVKPRELTDMKKHEFFIGIDTGVKTGFAFWKKDDKNFVVIQTLPIHQVMDRVAVAAEIFRERLFVRVEDARKRKWFGNAGREQLQGAGSIKRDAKIWEDFLTDLKVDFELVAPKNNKTKLNKEAFKKMTGWDKQTTEHSRDAAMLVYGL